jgi:N-acetylmuramoyl-L-alanine amidase
VDLIDHTSDDLLVALIRGEAEAESIIGKIAVACVVRNRVHDPRWPNDYKGVILQRKQFSCFMPEYFRPEIMRHEWENIYWRECRLAAYSVLNDYVRDVTDGANLYWNPSIIKKPNWDWSKITILKRIGNHQFAIE